MKVIRFLRVWGAILILLTAIPSAQIQAAGFEYRNASGPGQPERQAATASEIEIAADSYGLPLANDANAKAYAKPSIALKQNEGVSFKVAIPEDGIYTVAFDMASADSYISPPEGQLQVDGAFPVEDAVHIVFPIFYKNTSNTFPLDRYGNQALIRQENLVRWTRVTMRDVNFSQKYPLQLNFSKGEHQFDFKVTKESMLLGSIYISPFQKDPDYTQYLKEHPAVDTSGVMIELEAEFPAFKDDTSIRPVSNRSLDVTPYDTYQLLLNTLGGDAWKNSGSTVYYEVNAPAEGMYNITLREIQNFKNNFTVFRRVTVNDIVPFDQLNEIPFTYSTQWVNLTLGGSSPYKVYLHKGVNLLGIEANTSPYNTAIENVKKALVDINNLSLEIRKLTGNQVDQYKEWVITDYIPDIKDQLVTIANHLEVDKQALTAINQNGGSQEILSYQMAIDNILFLAGNPDKIPLYMNRFSQGSGSAASLLGTLLTSLQAQPLALDKIYVHSPDMHPQSTHVPFFRSFSEGIKRFVRSFQPDPYQSIYSGEDELDVWVNRPRQYVDLLQTLTDEGFTKDTGIKVKFSIMPDEAKLILANAAGIQPDVALGVSTDKPYELAIRTALKDLRSFNDFDSFIKIYSPGSLLSYIVNDSVYAIPETQDFWVTFYRKDILDSLKIPIPKTWNDVVEILPELQRYGMNYNTPLSAGAGTKGYLMTAPYIFNFGGKLYSNDGFSTALNSEADIAAIRFMAESFTIYGMPLTTSSFYESFRYGSVPIGISNMETYIKLYSAAPELNGLWGIDLYPATVLADGTQNRYATGSAQSCIMFSKTKKPDESWKFMKWWMSTQTQVDFQQQLILNYGPEYLWSSANLEAFQYSAMPPEHRDVVYQQWQWLQEPVKLPGSYMEEREISNAWNRIVFDGVNPRVAIDSSTTIINREITRKMEEFGYLKNGVKVKEFNIPTIDTVKRWIANGN